MISDETIREIKQRTSIVDLISEKVRLTSKGSLYLGLCPFHQENTPSFHVWPDQNSYYCFGCQANGDVFSFLMELSGLSFTEAVEQLAARLNIPVKYTQKDGRQSSSSGGRAPTAAIARRLAEVNHRALQYFRSSLAEAPPVVREYLIGRGLNRELVNTFKIGFAPQGGLTKFLNDKSIESALFELGLLKRSDRGRVYETFQQRVIFPILERDRRIIGFGGRIIPPLMEPDRLNQTAKYLNSPETPLYSKKRVLYGLPQALDEIRRQKTVYVVEGYLDVIGLHRVGVKNVVATCGTALTPEHATLIKRAATRVRLLYDSDRAGRQAAAKAFRSFLTTGLDVKVLFLPEGEDPDSLASSYGDETRQLLESKLKQYPVFEHYLNHLIEDYGGNISSISTEARFELAKRVGQTCTELPFGPLRETLTDQIAAKLNLSTERLRELWRDFSPTKSTATQMRPSQEATHTARKSSGSSLLNRSEQHYLRILLMGLLIEKEKFPSEIFESEWLKAGLSQKAQAFAEALYCVYDQTSDDEQNRQAALQSFLSGAPTFVLNLVKEVKQMDQTALERVKGELTDALTELEVTLPRQREIKRLKVEIASTSDESRKQELVKQLVELNQTANSPTLDQ